MGPHRAVINPNDTRPKLIEVVHALFVHPASLEVAQARQLGILLHARLAFKVEIGAHEGVHVEIGERGGVFQVFARPGLLRRAGAATEKHLEIIIKWKTKRWSARHPVNRFKKLSLLGRLTTLKRKTKPISMTCSLA